VLALQRRIDQRRGQPVGRQVEQGAMIGQRGGSFASCKA
jgi:hypothetical protein